MDQCVLSTYGVMREVWRTFCIEQTNENRKEISSFFNLRPNFDSLLKNHLLMEGPKYIRFYIDLNRDMAEMQDSGHSSISLFNSQENFAKMNNEEALALPDCKHMLKIVKQTDGTECRAQKQKCQCMIKMILSPQEMMDQSINDMRNNGQIFEEQQVWILCLSWMHAHLPSPQ